MFVSAALAAGQRTLKSEARALEVAATRLDERFLTAVDLISGCRGKVIVTGLGKSGYVARKIASSFASTGTPAFYLHPGEALHGDLGVVGRDDVVIAIAFGGQTAEVIAVCRLARRLEIPIIAITGNLESSLAEVASVALDGRVAREACPLNLAPTTSSVVALGLGDALVVAVMEGKGFTPEQFGNLHPAGSLGRKLAHVVDLMYPRADLPLLEPEADFNTVLSQVMRDNLGLAVVEEPGTGRLLGVISDGDVRRALMKRGAETLSQKAADLMSKAPKTIADHELAVSAIQQMEELRITRLVVVNQERKAIGLLRIMDLIAAKVV